MNQRGLAPLIVVGFVAALAVIGMAGYFAWRASMAQTPSQNLNQLQNFPAEVSSTPAIAQTTLQATITASSSRPAIETATTTTKRATSSNASPQTLRSVLALTGSQTCTFTDTNFPNGGTLQGVVYSYNGNMLADLTTATGNVGIKIHMIINSTYFYEWLDGAVTGVENLRSSLVGSSTALTVLLDKTVNLKCMNSNVDMSKFNLPAGTTFIKVQ